MTAYDEIKALTRKMFDRASLERHPLFVLLEENRLSPEQVRIIALQIFHVVDHFPRFLAALLTSIPDYRMRMPLVENLFEEHGRMSEKAVHVETYRDFLKSLGLSAKDIEASRPLIPVIAYNRAVTDLCLHHPFPEGLGALGVIEEIVARVSPLVARYALRHLSVRAGSVGHFADHERLDVTHADEIYGIAATVFHGETRPLVERGLALGMYYHRRLYTDLLEEPHDASSPRLVPTSCKSTPRVRPLPRPCATGRLKRRRFFIT